MRKLLLLLLLCGFARLSVAQEPPRVTEEPVAVAGGGDAFFMRPVFAPVGDHLAFTSGKYQGLWVLDLATRELRALTDEPAAGYGFAWSPDGTALLTRVARFDGPRRSNAVKLFDLDGGAWYLTEYRPRMPVLPRWSADGSTVYLYSRGVLEAFDTGRPADPSKAAAPVFLTDGARIGTARQGETVATLRPFDDDVLNLAASPDGSRLAFERLGGHLYAMNADGTGLTDLGPGHRPAWSPDGQWIVFTRMEDDGHSITAADLYAVRPDGGALARLTDTPERLEMNPSWSPDGAFIAFDALDEGVIYLLPVAE